MNLTKCNCAHTVDVQLKKNKFSDISGTEATYFDFKM